MSTDKRLEVLERIRTTNNYTKAHIASELGAPLPQYYTNWLRRNGLPKRYYDAADDFIDAHGDSETKLTPSKPAYAQPKKGRVHITGYAPKVSIQEAEVDYHAAEALAERLPSKLQLKLAQTLLNKLMEDESAT